MFPPPFLVSSAENSLNVPGSASFATNSLQEISLNKLADKSCGPCSKKSIFCSTPSVGSFSKRSHLLPLSTSDQSAALSPLSASCIGVLNTFEEDLDSPGQSVSPPCSATCVELHFEEQSHSSFGEQEPSGDLFMQAKNAYKRRRCSGEAKIHTEDQDIKTKNGGKSQSLYLSTDEIESNSHFLSAAGDRRVTMEAQKEKCLTMRCTVQLERLNNLSVTQLCSQTAYSSCLGHSGSGYSPQTTENSLRADSIQIVDLSQFSQPSVHLYLSMNNSKASGSLQSVNSEEAGMTCNTNSTNPDENRSEIECTHNTDDPESLTHSGEITEKTMASNRRPLNNSSPVAETQYVDAEKVLTAMQKKKCLTGKPMVGIKTLTSSQLKETLELRDKKLLSSHHSYSDDQIKNRHQSESYTNHINEDISATKVGLKKRGLTSSKKVISSDKEAPKNSCNIPHKRKKTAAKEKKRRNTSTDRHGSTRKVCVSGLSVSRWKNKDGASTHTFRSRTVQVGGNKTVDCSISELISAQQKQPRVRTTCTQTQHSTTETFLFCDF